MGQPPNSEQFKTYLDAYFGDQLTEWEQQAIAEENQTDEYLLSLANGRKAIVQEALQIRELLKQNTDELTNLLRGLNGEYILPAPGGDLLRDGTGVLPTGRNIHALDPYRMPSPAAYERGREIAQKIIAKHLE